MEFFDKLFSKNSPIEVRKTNKDLDVTSLRLKKNEEEFLKKLLSDFALECCFYFTRPLLTVEEFDNVEFSVKFRKTFYLYEGYKRSWEIAYSRYAWACNVNKLLVELLSEEFIDIEGNEMARISFNDMLEKRLNRKSDMFKHCFMLMAFTWGTYRDMWMVNKYEPHLIEDKIKRDLLINIQWSMKDICDSYGGLWLPYCFQTIEQFNKRD